MHRRLLAIAFIALSPCILSASPDAARKQTVYDYAAVDMEGKVIHLSDYKGKVLLIVNLASKSEFNGQIKALNQLQKEYADRGLLVIGIPSRDFGGEELTDSAALRKYYTDLHASFPIFAPATLRGVQTIPLYKFLCNPKEGLPGGELHWNYTKFLIDRQGEPLARYEVGEDPGDVNFHVIVENALNGKFRKQGSKTTDLAMQGGGDDQ